MNIDDALSYVQDPGNEHYGKIINLTADITSGVSAININDKNDVVIGLGQYNLTCPSLTITNGSLILWGESNTTGTQGMFTVSGGISLDNGVFITQDDEGKMARVIAEGVSPTVDIITATNGSIVEINGGFISNAAGATGSGIKADGGSKVKAGGGVISAPGSIGVSASGKGTVVEITDNIIALGTGVYAVSEAKVTVDSYIWGMQGDGIYAYGGANVTVNNNTTFPVFGFFKGIYAEGAGTTVSVKGSVESLSTAPEVYPEVAVEAIDGAKVTVDASMFPNGSVLGTDFGAYAEGEGTFISIKTADGGSLGIRGYGDCVAHASGGGEIYVNGDLDTGSGTYTGARVRNGGKITVDGEIQTNTLSTYIDLGDAAGDKKTRTQFDGTTTKPGYYTFSKTDAGKTNTVWVRVQQPSHVCYIEEIDEYFTTIQDAVTAVWSRVNGATITLLQDIDSPNPIYLNSSGLELIIDLNGHNLTVDNSITSPTSAGLFVGNTTKVTFDNSGAGGKTALMKGINSGIRVYDSSSIVLTERFKAGKNTLDAVGYPSTTTSIGLEVANSNVTVTSATGQQQGTEASIGSVVEVLGDSIANRTGASTIYGVYAVGGSQVTVGGDAKGGYYGAYAYGVHSTTSESSKIIVKGSAIGTGADSYGAYASGEGIVIVEGDADALRCGAFSTIAGSLVEVYGNATAHGTSGTGAFANAEGKIIVYGDATALGTSSTNNNGVEAHTGGIVEVYGNANGFSAGAYAYPNGPVSSTQGGNVTVHGKAISGKYGINASGLSTVSVGAVEIIEDTSESSTTGVYVYDGAKVFIAESIINRSTSASQIGVLATRIDSVANEANEVTVGGDILFTKPSGTTYIRLGNPVSTDREKGDSQTTPEKPGYLTYTENGAAAGNNVVWVKDESSPPVIMTQEGPLKDGRVGEAYNERIVAATGGFIETQWNIVPGSGALPPGLMLDRDTGEISGTPTAAGAYTFAVEAFMWSSGSSGPATFSIMIDPAQPKPPVANLLSISPTHAIVTSSSDKVVFEAILNMPDADYSILSPSYSGAPDMRLDIDETNKGAGIFSVKVVHDPPPLENIVPGTLAFTITYPDGSGGYYKATATIEVIPGGIDANTTAKLLETKVTVNKAKEVGALVPVLITDQKPYDMGLTAFSVGSGSSEPKTGSQVARTVELYTQNSKTKEWDVPLPNYTANMYGDDQRFIEINAAPAAKKTTKAFKAKVYICSSGSNARLDAGTISITTVEKWPTLKAKAGGLNLFLPDNTAPLAVTAADGSAVFIDSIKTPAAKGYFSYDGGALSLTAVAVKGTVKNVVVNVSVAGYKPVPASKMPKVNVKIVNTAPKVKLAKTSVKLLKAEDFGTDPVGAAKISLVTSDKKVPFESGYKVEDVELSEFDKKGNPVVNPNVDIAYDKGVISVTPKSLCKSGKALLKVSYKDTTAVAWLTLTVTIVDITKVTVTPKVKAATVNPEHSNSKLIDVPITLNVANYTSGNWSIKSQSNDGKPAMKALTDDAFNVAYGANFVSVRVVDNNELANIISDNNNESYKFAYTIKNDDIYTVNSAGVHVPRTFKLTITVAAKKTGFSVSTKSKIDIANPASAVTATVKLTNTTSDIDSVTLYNTGGKLEPSVVSTDFKVTNINGKTFRIVAAHDKVVPGVKQKLSAKIKLKNGEELMTWAEVLNKNGTSKTPKEYKDKPIAITPAQGKGKATQSLKAVTLYKPTPQYGGGPVRLNLTKPANVKLGVVSVNQASVKAMKLSDGGFRLEQNGSNDYTIYFADGRAPAVYGATGKLGKLKASYTLKIDLWAEGTYKLNSVGQPVALGYYNANGKWVAKSKPTTVKVKVNIK